MIPLGMIRIGLYPQGIFFIVFLTKKDIKISKIKGKKITFKYKDKEYTAKKSDDVYVFGDKVFECN